MSEVTLESQLIDIIKDEDMAENIKVAKVDMLIRLGVDVHQKNDYDQTALMWASENSYKEIVELLIQKGADVNQKNESGMTALMWASRDGYTDVVEVLIQNGAEVNQKDEDGETALMIAKDEKTKKAIIEAVKKRNEKTGENVIVQGIERE